MMMSPKAMDFLEVFGNDEREVEINSGRGNL